MTGGVKPREALERARGLLESVRGAPLERTRRAELAEQLAALLLEASLGEVTPVDRTRAATLGRLMRDVRGQAFTTALTDRVHRSRDANRTADQLGHLVRMLGVPRYLAPWDRAQLLLGARVGGALPELTVRGARRRIRRETAGVLLSAREEALGDFLAARRREGVRVNLNQLGEALLGEAAAEERVEHYVTLARRTDLDALSVKVSSIGSQLHLLAFERTVSELAARLARIYAATLDHPAAARPLVMLDMEAYRHADLTFAAMQRALSDRTLDGVRAGIVLQAYVPEANRWQRELIAWAGSRVERGGSPLRMRLVKGANLAHERVEAAKAGVELPMFASKLEVDANYKRMLERGLTPAALRVVRLGVASHNLFDLAYALVLSYERDVAAQVGLEMLEGMADPVRRAIVRLGCELLSYAPICDDDDLNVGIAYLVRRLDENTSAENFLSSSFAMRPHDAAFERERRRFRHAVERIDVVDETPRRSAEPSFDRRHAEASRPAMGVAFRNEPDTDFAQAENRRWIERALASQLALEAPLLGSIIAGERTTEGERRAGEDPSRPGSIPYQFALASPAAVERALSCAAADPAGFSRTRPEERARLLMRIAGALRGARAELIALMVLDGGKRVSEADSEVSEAIDFAEYYRSSFLALQREQPVELAPRGTVLVTPPWNFPLAIPAGGVLAALMAGNRVIIKPALETVWIAERMVRLFHAAGVPKSALQLVLCEDEVGSALVRDPRVQSVVLTGATDTARLFHRLRPGLLLLAETGGKNPYIVSALSDRDQAIADVVQSAFGHSGQKCSAASLLILEAEVHDDPHFLANLADAVASLPVGSAWDPASVITPLIRPPEGPLRRALEQLEPGERWLVEPRSDPHNPRLVSPGVKLGVQPGSFTHLTELFGPVLAVMRADSLDHALALANATGYGLTAGLASLDEREQARFIERVQSGNVYVNRTTTGAIVERQPFGGFGKSGYGPGAKAGGPNYVVQLCQVAPNTRRARRLPARRLPRPLARRLEALAPALPPTELERLNACARDYLQAHEEHFAHARDPQALLGQDNLFRYLPCQGIVLRVEENASALELAASSIAAELCGVRLHISVSPDFQGAVDADLFGHPLRVEPLVALEGALRHAPRLRLLGRRTPEHEALCARHGTHLADAPVLPVGRFELLHYLREQSVSVEYHRYGQLGMRAPERRRRK